MVSTGHTHWDLVFYVAGPTHRWKHSNSRGSGLQKHKRFVHYILISAIRRHLYVCRLPKRTVCYILTHQQAHRPSMDMALLRHQERKPRGTCLPVPSSTYLSSSLVLFTRRTHLALERKREDLRNPKRHAAERSIGLWHVDERSSLPQLLGIDSRDATVDGC